MREDLIELAKQQAAEIARAGHNGWGNTMLELAAALEAAREDACVERCKRRHPHTKLTLTRDAAPDTGWHWSVTLPDGHLYDVSQGRMTFEQVRADLVGRGLTAFDAADTVWRAALAAQPGGSDNDR